MPKIEEPLEIPDWLTTEFMEKALKNSFKDNEFRIVESDVKMAAGVEDHYGSQIFRYSLTDQNSKKLSVIVKATPRNALSDLMDISQVFEEEIFVYSEILPVIDSFLKKVDPRYDRLWPEGLYFKRRPNSTLILEDLRPGGFTLANRFGGLDEKHGVLVVKALAKFHAGSFVMLQENPDVLKGHEENVWNQKGGDILLNMVKYPFMGLVRSLPDWPDFEKKEYYIEKLKKLEDVVLDKVFEAWKVNEERVNVCVHGDAWTNNFMFRYDSRGIPDAIKIVDFQIIGYGSPVMDLQYFIFSSMRAELKFDYLDCLLENYCKTFQETVDKLGVNVRYGMDEIKRDLNEKGFWGFMVLCSIFPLVTAPKEDTFDPNEYFGKERLSFEKHFKNEEVRSVLKRVLQYYDEKGII